MTLELEVEVAGKAVDEDEVMRPVAVDRISDRDVATSGVTDVGRLHQHSLARPLAVWVIRAGTSVAAPRLLVNEQTLFRRQLRELRQCSGMSLEPS